MKILDMPPIRRCQDGFNRSVLRWLVMACLVFAVAAPAGLKADKAWYPLAVDVWTPPFNEAMQRQSQQYTPLQKASQPWRIKVFIPHLKDAYWLGVNFGLIDEARRLGISLTIQEAGGYSQLAVQRRQTEAALSEKPDGLIIGAISLEGLNDLVAQAAEKGTPVIDLINGMSSPQIAARAAVSFRDMGFASGRYLQRMQSQMGRPAKVAWFPGPENAGWVQAGDAGFREAIEGNAIEIVETLYGDTGSGVQGRLIEDVLDRHADTLDFIVGTAVTAEAAVKILRTRRLSDKIKIVSYYYGPGVHRGIRRGHILAAPSDQPVLQARIAIDVIVRILEGKDYIRHVAPKVVVVDRTNIRSWDSASTLAPRGFRPIFSVNEQQ
ncbi:MAG: TMAO reductase system periplasmic protein TorT [Desulfobacterales bacterium]|nr:TMAO reductase system periplasmic protein TorT [Desulfobacterales bacterium]